MPTPKPETQTEYRVVGESPISFNGVRLWARHANDIAEARRIVSESSARGNSNVRIRQRTITTTPWVDLEAGEEG